MGEVDGPEVLCLGIGGSPAPVDETLLLILRARGRGDLGEPPDGVHLLSFIMPCFPFRSALFLVLGPRFFPSENRQ